jgi:hypothetical protein
MADPDELERRHTMLTAAAHYDRLSTREALAGDEDPGDDQALTDDEALANNERPAGDEARATTHTGAPTQDTGLTKDEALELLALSEVIARKAGYGRQLTVRSARRAGASWSQIGAALGTSKQAAWEAHTRWIEGQAEQHRRSGYEGLDAGEAAAARALAGRPGEPAQPGEST